MAYALAITDNIHIGSGIINITPPVCHPARVAEKVAMLDQLAPGRFEFGRRPRIVVDRGVRVRHRLDGHDTRHVRRGPARDREDDGPDEYGPYEGEFFSLPRRRLPKPVTLPHPPIWVAAGSPGHVREGGAHGDRRARRYEAIGADQVSFGSLSDDTPFDAAVESVETFGKFVLPEFDKDPVHSTTRQRESQIG